MPYNAASCLMLVCECLRMLTDNNSQLSGLAAEAGLVDTVLRSMDILANNKGYNKVCWGCKKYSIHDMLQTWVMST